MNESSSAGIPFLGFASSFECWMVDNDTKLFHIRRTFTGRALTILFLFINIKIFNPFANW